MKKLTLLSLNIAFLSTLGCSFPMEQVGLFKGDTLPKPQVLPLGGDTQITFDVVKENSLNTCNNCHEDHDFEMTPESIIAFQGDIVDRINGKGGPVMPPRAKGYQPLNECQKAILTTWLEDQKIGRSSQRVSDIAACNGQNPGEVKPTPEPSATPTPTPTATPEPTPEPAVDFATLEVSFANLTKYILEPKCLRCHVPVEGKDRTLLTTVSDMQGQELIASTAEASVLYQVVIPGLNKRFMPPTRSGIPALTPAEADYLKRWILTVPPNEFF